MKKTFAVLGGDRRQIELARLLAQDGQQVFTCALGLPTDRPLEDSGRGGCGGACPCRFPRSRGC